MNSQRLTIFLLAFIALSYTLWIKPQQAQVETQTAQLERIQSEIASINGSKPSVDTTSELSDLDGNLLREAIPEGFDQDTLITELKTLASDHKINLSSISFSQSSAEQSNQIKAVQMNLSLNGNPNQLKSFLSALENANRGFFVNSLGFSYGTVNDVEMGTLNLTIEAFYS